MRKFKVVNVAESITRVELKTGRTKEGTRFAYPQYREVKRGEEGWVPCAYGYEDIKVGDILELDGHLAQKAASNPDFEEVVEQKRKPGRPKKNAA